MLFLLKFVEELVLPPSVLSKNIKNIIKSKLLDKVQGSVSEKYGYIICVVNVDDTPNGKILDTTGDLLFTVSYRAVVMKPFRGEVCEGVIYKLDQFGIHVAVGPMSVYISNFNFPPQFKYNEVNKIYVSDTNEQLKENTTVRFRITGIQYIQKEFKPTGTMSEDYLGIMG